MYRGLPVRGLKWHPRNHHILFAAACDGGIYALDTNSLSCTKVAQGIYNNKLFKYHCFITQPLGYAADVEICICWCSSFHKCSRMGFLWCT